MPQVLVTPLVLHRASGPYREVLEQGGFQVSYPPEGLSLKDPAVLISQLGGIDAVIASMEPYNRQVIAASGLRVISRNGVGEE